MNNELELKVGRTYRAKRPAPAGSLEPLFNDRTIVYMNQNQVQYDGPSVKIGRRRPTVKKSSFLKWAGRDVTDILPEGEYEPFKKEVKPRRPRVKKDALEVIDAMSEKEQDEWMADDSGRRGYRALKYWDIRHKSMTPPEAYKAVIDAVGLTGEEEGKYIFNDFSTVGFFTQDTKLALEVIDRGCEFLFDKASGVWFIDMFGHHQIVMSHLQAMYTNTNSWKIGHSEAADLYIEQCRGFFESGAGGYGPPCVRMSEYYILPAELKTAFNRLGFKIWRM